MSIPRAEEEFARGKMPVDGPALVKRLIWSAGFLEGEGSFVNCGKRGSFGVRAVQVNREPLEQLQAYFGGSISEIDRSDRTDRRKYQPMFTWSVWGSRAVGLAFSIFLLMSQKRRGQIRKAIQKWKTQSLPNRDKTHCVRGHEFNAANTYFYTGKRGQTQRYCKTCQRNTMQSIRVRQAQERGRERCQPTA